jgi:hypothetical protein
MLQTLKRLHNQNDDFASAELPLLVRYFQYVARNRQPKLLAQLWDRLPTEVREAHLRQGLEQAIKYNSVPAAEFLLKKFMEIRGPQALSELFNGEYYPDLFQSAANHNSLEVVDLIIRSLDKNVGPHAVKEIIPWAGPNLRQLAMAEKIFAEAREWGGQELVEETLNMAIRSVVNLATADHPKQPQDKADPNILSYLISQIHPVYGAEPILEALKEIGEYAEFSGIRAKQAEIGEIITKVAELAGLPVLKEFFVENDVFLRDMSMAGAHDLVFGIVEPLLKKIDDSVFYEQATDTIDLYFTAGLSDEIVGQLELAKKGEILPAELDKYVQGIGLAAKIEGNFPEHLRGLTGLALRSEIIRELVVRGKVEDLRNFSELHCLLGEPSVYPEALLYLHYIWGWHR